MTTRDRLDAHPLLRRALGEWSGDDPVLSSGQRGLARIVAVLAGEFDQLDGAEQAAIAGVLTTTATETGAAEQYARELIRRAK